MITLDQKLGLRMFAFCLVLVFTLTVYGDNPGVTINVDAATGRHAINPNIYGTAHASTVPVRRRAACRSPSGSGCRPSGTRRF